MRMSEENDDLKINLENAQRHFEATRRAEGLHAEVAVPDAARAQAVDAYEQLNYGEIRS